MSDSQRRILEMVAEKKITVEEAAQLLSATESTAGVASGGRDVAQATKPKPKYLRVVVQPTTESGEETGHEHVNIRVPMALIRAGLKLTALIPSDASERVNEVLRGKGIDVDLRKISADDLEQLVDALSELEVDVKDKKEKVRIYLE